MKKINLLLIAILLVVTVSAQNRRAEKKLIGTWTLEEVELENMDEIAQKMSDMYADIFDPLIAQLEEMIESIKEEEDKKSYIGQLEDLKKEKEEHNLENLKKEITQEFDYLTGNVKYVFNKDKTFKSLLDDKKGAWKINKKVTKLTMTEGEEDIIFHISKLTKNKLFVTIIEEQGEMTMRMNMTFTKNKK